MPATPEIQFKMELRPTLKDLKGRFTKANAAMHEANRDFMRDEGRRLTELLEGEAPRSESGEGEHFADNIRFRTFVEGNNRVGFRISYPEPLGKFILDGTKPHTITSRGAPFSPLAFFWEDGPDGPDMYFYMSVRHPGTSANKFVGRATRRWFPGFRSGAKKITHRYVSTVRGKESKGTF